MYEPLQVTWDCDESSLTLLVEIWKAPESSIASLNQSWTCPVSQLPFKSNKPFII